MLGAGIAGASAPGCGETRESFEATSMMKCSKQALLAA